MKSYMKHRQAKAVMLKEKLRLLYVQIDKGEIALNEQQRVAMNDLHVEHMTKARELGEEYMQKEIDIIMDLGGKYAPKVVAPKGNIVIK